MEEKKVNQTNPAAQPTVFDEDAPIVHPFSLESVVYLLLKNERFYANFLIGSTVVYDHKDVPTAAAQLKKGEIVFYFNTDFMSRNSIHGQADILKHEIRHILLDHCGKRGQKYGKLNHKIKNIAMDCAINQDLKHLPKGCITLEGLQKQTGMKLDPNETWEYYYQHIMNDAKAKGNITYVVDNHGMMDDSEGGEEGDAEYAINRAAVKSAIDKAVKSSAGHIPGEVQRVLDLFEKSRLPWKQVLRNFVAKSRHSDKKMTRTKVHRRFGIDQPGSKKKRRLTLGVCVDTSGSVSDEAFMAFMTEIHTVAKSTSVTYLVQADASIQKVDIIKGGKPKKEKLRGRSGYGGTAYQPAIDYCKKMNVDCIIYMGDLDSADTPTDPGIPFLWVRVGKSNPPGNFGRILDLD